MFCTLWGFADWRIRWVGAWLRVCLRCVVVTCENADYFSCHYYGRMYIILDFRNIFLDIHLLQLVLGIVFFRSLNFSDSGFTVGTVVLKLFLIVLKYSRIACNFYNNMLKYVHWYSRCLVRCFGDAM